MCLRTLYFINKCDYNVYFEILFFYWLSSCSAEIKLLKMGSITLQLFHFQILLKILHLSNKCDDDISIWLKTIDYKEFLSDSIPCFHGLERNIQTKTCFTKMSWKWFQESNYWLPMNKNCRIVMFLNHNYRIVRVVF